MIENASKSNRPPDQRRTWEEYCGFIRKPVKHFREIQDALLMAQLGYLQSSGLWKKIAGDASPRTPEQFRRDVPLTTYEDYREIFAGRREELLPGKIKFWAQTPGSGGEVKNIPYTEMFHDRLGEFLIAALTLSSPEKDTFPVQAGDIFLCAVPSYASGLAARAALEELGMLALPPFDETENITLTDRVVAGLMTALEKERIGAIWGAAAALVNIGRMFESRLGEYLTSDEAEFDGKGRILERYLEARSDGRPLLPKDFFSPKVILCAGADVEALADSVEKYWGRRPAECYAMAEAGMLAVQPFGCDGMVFVPNAAHLEFIPEDERSESRPPTRLIGELEAGRRYEPVVTNFHGGCMLRYRTGDLIEVISTSDDARGVKIPLIRFDSRAGNVIDIPGPVRLNEKACWKMIEAAGVNYTDWVVASETRNEKLFVHFYVETFEPRRRVLGRLKKAAARAIESFDGVLDILGYNPLNVTTLAEGVFEMYKTEMEAGGAAPGQMKPTRVNPKPEHLARIVRIDAALKKGNI